MMKRIATLETLRKKRSRRNLHSPIVDKASSCFGSRAAAFATPASQHIGQRRTNPTTPRDPLPHSSHLPHNPLPPIRDCGIPTSDLSDLGFKGMHMGCLRGDLCASFNTAQLCQVHQFFKCGLQLRAEASYGGGQRHVGFERGMS